MCGLSPALQGVNRYTLTVSTAFQAVVQERAMEAEGNRKVAARHGDARGGAPRVRARSSVSTRAQQQRYNWRAAGTLRRQK